MGPYEFKEQHAYDFARTKGKTREKGEEIELYNCPYCQGGRNDHWTFAINKKSGQFKCLRSSCGVSGNMLTLAKDFDFSLGKDYEEYYVKKTEYKRLPQPKVKIVPKQTAIDFLVNRGISKETTERYQITAQKENDHILVFPFFDEKNIMQFVKYRNTNFIKGQGNKEWCESGCKPILFGMAQCNKNFDRVIITEGQIDSLSISECGIENAVSVPTGAQGFTWIPHCWDWFSKFKEIIVFGDYEKGKITLLEELNNRFKPKVKFVRPENYLGCKDANEILVKHGKQAILEAVNNAESTPIKKVVELADVEKVDVYNLPKLKTGIYDLDRLLKGGLPFGQTDIIGGKRGEGKSTLASQILVNAVDQGYNVFAYSGELTGQFFKSWVDMQVAGDRVVETVNSFGDKASFVTNSDTEKINSWYRGKFLIYDNTSVDDEEEDLFRTVERVVVQHGCKVILIDNLMTAIDLDCSMESNKWERQSMFVKRFVKLSIRYNIIVLLVAHRRKSGSSIDINDEISGSGDITNLAGVVFSYDKVDKEQIDAPRVLKLSKSRLGGVLNEDGIPLYYDDKSKRIYGQKDNVHKTYSWVDTDGFRPITDEEMMFV